MTASSDSRFDVEYDGEIPADVDEAALRRMEAVANALDEIVRVPGTDISVGIDPILGVIPVAGDLISTGISLYIVVEAANLGVSYTTLLEMIATISIDAVGGSVPLVGPIFDSFWRANKRNVQTVFDDLAEPVTDGSSESDETQTAVDIPIQTD